MENILKKYKIGIGKGSKTVFSNENDIYQDGTLPMYRDSDGTLWAISGHTHVGHIGVFKGSCFSDLREAYPAHTNFHTGKAGAAFDGIKYPEGILSRGSVWPMGLYICPRTHRFFCFFHNETGWNGQGSGYDSWGLCEKPRFDSDFRHIGLMYSDDEGRTWDFSRWVVTSQQVCFSERYNPDKINVIGQRGKTISLGSGDFTLFVNRKDGFLYLIYNILTIEKDTGNAKRCDAYYARSRIRTDGTMGDFVKYYNGSFCEAGNLGKETAIVKNSWHSRVVFSKKLNAYLMASSPIVPDCRTTIVADYLEFRTSRDLLSWSEPVCVEKDGKKFGGHYHGLLSFHAEGAPQIVEGEEFTLTLGSNGTDVVAYDFKMGAYEKD